MTDLSWKDDRTPLSVQFDDIYYADEDGLAEARYIFIEGTDLCGQLSSRGRLQVAELGFGTGLNFLATVDYLQKLPDHEISLHFFSVEKFPLSKDQIRRALSRWPEIDSLTSKMLAQYQPDTEGWTKVHISESIQLHLWIGDVIDFLKLLPTKIDAWYLDGFSPRKNPEMWSTEVFEGIARKSAPGSRFSTFASAGFVRRGLESSGFQVQKRPGFGRKRDSLSGHFLR
ncbi:MAG: hypothetical protein EA369_02365 [Bradymonadales bacterium]|nr:MAG: hypothetical protein EA369_02365 [Bradymonadales bacterium]